MGKLIFVRHGQASFLSDNYDNLSDMGRQQCRHLGEYWVRHDVAIDRVYIGPRVRHRQSAEEAAVAFEAAGRTLPEPVMLPELDEFAWGELMAHARGPLAQTDPQFGAFQRAFEESEDPDVKFRAVQNIIERICLLWARGDIRLDSVEPWPDFAARVVRAIEIMTEDGGGTVAIFTSGGTVSAALRHALHLDPVKSLELIWTLRNGAITEFLHSNGRFNLGCFNEASHLPAPEYWTYR